ncbi:MAG: hypothetical protein GEU71_05700 [Actinobacteria bacterium]|nr:hypothetical protein [Actinomycetota bacterium]
MSITRRIAGTLAVGALLWALAPIALGPPGGDETRTGVGARSERSALEAPEAADVRFSFDKLRYQAAAKRLRTETPGLFLAAALALLLGARFIGFRGTDPRRLPVLSDPVVGGRAPPGVLAAV